MVKHASLVTSRKFQIYYLPSIFTVFTDSKLCYLKILQPILDMVVLLPSWVVYALVLCITKVTHVSLVDNCKLFFQNIDHWLKIPLIARARLCWRPFLLRTFVIWWFVSSECFNGSSTCWHSCHSGLLETTCRRCELT